LDKVTMFGLRTGRGPEKAGNSKKKKKENEVKGTTLIIPKGGGADT